MSAGDHGPGVRVPPPVLVALMVGASLVLRALVPLPLGAPQPGLAWVAMGLGLALSVWTVVAMLRAGTDPRPDRPDSALLQAGPFRLTRNPIYLGFLLVVAGLALRWGDAWGWIALAAASRCSTGWWWRGRKPISAPASAPPTRPMRAGCVAGCRACLAPA